MQRILTLTGILCLLLSSPGMAQNATNVSHIKQLVTTHAAALGLNTSDLANYRISDSYYDQSTGLTMAYLQQTYKGVDVFNAIMSVAFKSKDLGAFQSSWINDAADKTQNKSSKPAVTPVTALRNAFSNLGLSFARPFFIPLSQAADGQEFEYDNMGVALDNINVRLMWVPESEDMQRLTLSWQVSFVTLKENNSWLIKIDAASGRLISKANLTTKCIWLPSTKHNVYAYEVESFDQSEDVEESVNDVTGIQAVDTAKYLVIPYPYMDPDHKAPTLVTNPWKMNGNTMAYTKKWNSDATMDYKDSLKGNNVLAYEDLNHDNKRGYSPPSQTPLPNLTWNYPANFTGDPTEDPSFGIVNLFYWNNLMHDMSYDYGFDEPSGNMQTSNFGRGGKANDLVIAEAMDGGDTSNANFAPAVDGKKQRMQMFLWRPSPLKLLKFNLPAAFAGPKPAAESNVSNNNKLAQKGIITQNVVLYKDALHPDSSTACGAAQNAAQISGKIAYIDRGSCSFVVKFQNAQAAGAKAIIVGNVAPDDPRYTDGSTGNILVIMSASPLVNSITIPGVFIYYDTAQKLKGYLLANITTNATLSPTPMIDGDLDNGIPAHEYTHGISNRLTGGANTVSCLNNGEQMGEGWSDYFALMMTTNWSKAKVSDGAKPRPIGNYALGLDSTYGGIRTYPYSKNFAIDPWTYDSLQLDPDIHEYNVLTHPEAVYYTGEVWCSALWDMTWNLIKTEGINKTFFKAGVAGGNTTAMRLVMQGLKLQKCSPGCLDGRDAILKADTILYGGIHGLDIWTAFARRGMGYSAVQGSNSKIKDGHGAYDLPPGLVAPKTDAVTAKQLDSKPLITISPNPTKDYLVVNIPGNTQKLNIQLMSNNGAAVGAYVLTNDNLRIDVSKLAAGVYNLLITGETYTSRFRVVIQ